MKLIVLGLILFSFFYLCCFINCNWIEQTNGTQIDLPNRWSTIPAILYFHEQIKIEPKLAIWYFHEQIQIETKIAIWYEHEQMQIVLTSLNNNNTIMTHHKHENVLLHYKLFYKPTIGN